MLVDNPEELLRNANRIIDSDVESAIELCDAERNLNGDNLVEKVKFCLLKRSTNDLSIVLRAHENGIRTLRTDIIDAILSNLVERAFLSGDKDV